MISRILFCFVGFLFAVGCSSLPSSSERVPASPVALNEFLKEGDVFSMDSCSCAFQDGIRAKMKTVACAPGHPNRPIAVDTYKEGSPDFGNVNEGLVFRASRLEVRIGRLEISKGIYFPHAHGFQNLVLTNSKGAVPAQGSQDYDRPMSSREHQTKGSHPGGEEPSRDYDVSQSYTNIFSWRYGIGFLSNRKLEQRKVKVDGFEEIVMGLISNDTRLEELRPGNYMIEATTRLEGTDIFNPQTVNLLKDIWYYQMYSLEEQPRTQVYKVRCQLSLSHPST